MEDNRISILLYSAMAAPDYTTRRATVALPFGSSFFNRSRTSGFDEVGNALLGCAKQKDIGMGSISLSTFLSFSVSKDEISFRPKTRTIVLFSISMAMRKIYNCGCHDPKDICIVYAVGKNSCVLLDGTNVNACAAPVPFCRRLNSKFDSNSTIYWRSPVTDQP